MNSTNETIHLSRFSPGLGKPQQFTQAITIGPGSNSATAQWTEIKEETKSASSPSGWKHFLDTLAAVLFPPTLLVTQQGDNDCIYTLEFEVNLVENPEGWATLDGFSRSLSLESGSVVFNDLPHGTQLRAKTTRTEGVDTIRSVKIELISHKET